MGQAKKRGTFEERVLQAIRKAKVEKNDKTSRNGKVVDGKFVHTKRVPESLQLDEAAIKDIGDSMLESYKDPNSLLSKMTAEMRAKGIHCMKDDLDNGADIYELIRQGVYKKQKEPA